MSCRSMQGQLSLYAGRELSASEALIVESHLNQCDSCRAASAVYERTRSLLGRYGRQLGSSQDPKAVWQSLHSPAAGVDGTGAALPHVSPPRKKK